MILLLCQTTDVSQLINVIAAATDARCVLGSCCCCCCFRCLQFSMFVHGRATGECLLSLWAFNSARHNEGETQNTGTDCNRCNVNQVYLTEIAFIIKVHTWVDCKTAL